MKIINKCYMGVPALIKTIHDRPENRNFFIKNINSKVMAYLDENNEVVYNDYDSVCDELIQNKHYHNHCKQPKFSSKQAITTIDNKSTIFRSIMYCFNYFHTCIY